MAAPVNLRVSACEKKNGFFDLKGGLPDYVVPRMPSISSIFRLRSSKKKRARKGLPTTDKFAHAPASKGDVVSSVSAAAAGKSSVWKSAKARAEFQNQFPAPVIVCSDKSDFAIVEQAPLADDLGIDSWRRDSKSSTKMLLFSVALCKAAAAKSIASLTWAAVSTASSQSSSSAAAAMKKAKKSQQQCPDPSLVIARRGLSSTALPSSSTDSASISVETLPSSSTNSNPASIIVETLPSSSTNSNPASICSDSLATSGRVVSPVLKAREVESRSISSSPHRSDLGLERTRKWVIGTVQAGANEPKLQASGSPASCNLFLVAMVLLVVQAGLLVGQVQAIVITTCFWFLVHRLRVPDDPPASNSCVNVSSSNCQTSARSLSSSSSQRNDYSSSEYRKKVIIEGLLQRPVQTKI